VGQLTELLDEAIDSSRSLSHELSPQVLYEAGLGPALEWLAPRMENQHGLRIYVAAEEEAEPDAEDVKVLLFQAVRELLMNVVKHAGVDEAWMRMRHEDGDRLRLEVEDRGPGFDPEQTDKGDGGEQLGLFGIRERLRALSGEMKIDSAPGEGTRITLFASIHGDRPAVAEQHPGAGEAAAPDLENALPAKPEPVVEGAALEPEAADLTAAHPIRVLLVDDHRIVREGLAGILRGEPDIELVAEASDGQEAVERTERTEPDVVVMDVSMPRMDGTEATRIIRRDHPEIRVIGLSMHDREDLAQAMHEAGASAYLTKGGPASELIEAVRHHANNGHANA
jgi:CheY-like chemotaxis protein/anti-sigma regulatory factor (Ser/Thr protein kinase)